MADEEVVEEGKLATRLWNKFKNVSISAKYSPFIVCLASGTLNPWVFLDCICQDVHFLDAFLDGLRRAEECADNGEEKRAIRALWESVKQRLDSYDVRVSEWGFELPRQEISWGIAVTYAEFLLEVPGSDVTPFARKKLAAYTLAAMAPWMRLYASISKEINGLPETHERGHIYKKWVDDYCSQDFEAFTLQIEDLLEMLSISLNYYEDEVVERLYLRAMKLGVEHFAAQPVTQRSVLPLSLLQDRADSCLLMCCDFHMACFPAGTSSILQEIAIKTAEKVDTNRPGSQLNWWMSSTDLRNTWDTLAARHEEELNKFLGSIFASKTAAMFNYEGVCKALEQAADFEKRTNSRIVRCGVLKGLSREDINRAGKRLPLQDGCKEFFQKIVKSEKLKANVHIISYCFCGDLIRSAFSSGDPNVLDVLKVHSNELAYERSVSTGEIIKKVESPSEKLQIFSNILKECGANGQQLTVYVGGSVGDLLCLLKADIGIVIGSCTILRELGKHFGISFVPLFSGVIKKQEELAAGASAVWNGLQGILYTVSSWAEIHAFILGL